MAKSKKDQTAIATLGELKASGYTPKTIKEELRNNLIGKLKNKEKVFDGILGFDDTVIPDIERAILSRHSILLLGLRGQAKTRIARMLTTLLDEYIPVVVGSEINDDPLRPLSRQALDIIAEQGDQTPIKWVHRNERYVEKLATPDVSVADLIGDVDPIKAATLKLPYSDERVIHFGLVPRAHRSIFVLNELPDLQARIQVSLFNILQEGDLQIRGFKLRFPLDIQFVFTANPEDYTNRGSIVTPLKDRIESQILTHYPKELDIALAITDQEADITPEQVKAVYLVDELKSLLELVSFQARESDLIDENSGVSARLSISARENLISTAERRMLINGDTKTQARITDFWGVIPSITGKVELVYEGEQEGPYGVAIKLIEESIKEMFLEYFPHPDKLSKEQANYYAEVKNWFSSGNAVDLLNDDNEAEFKKKLDAVPGLNKIAKLITAKKADQYFYMELLLHGLSALEVIGKNVLDNSFNFTDPLARMFDNLDDEDDDISLN
jgi:magnesium chelatase subunit I